MYKTRQVLFFTVAMLLSSTVVAFAQQSLIPDFFQNIIDSYSGGGAGGIAGSVTNLVRLALTLLFGAVVLVAIVFSIMAAIKYIKSQGEAGEIEEANKAMKAIFQGLIAMFVGLIGIVVVFVIFDTTIQPIRLTDICVSNPESAACRICTEGEESGTNYVIKGGATGTTVLEQVAQECCGKTDPTITKCALSGSQHP